MTLADESRTGSAAASVLRVGGDIMNVNSYVVTGPTGVVVVDGQLTIADAQKVRAEVDRTGLPLAGLVITHPHPDHYAGAGIVAQDAPIITIPAVDEAIRREDDIKNTIVGPMMGDQWPTQRRFPDQLVEPGTTLELAGLSLRVETTGSGESHADTQYWLDDTTVFAGDLAYDHQHAYLADGHFAHWLEALAEFERRIPAGTQLYLGHGMPRDSSVLAEQRRYVQTFVEAVQAHAGDDPETRQAGVVARMQAVANDPALQFLMELSIEPVLAALTDRSRL